jgi:hypothetical protein
MIGIASPRCVINHYGGDVMSAPEVQVIRAFGEVMIVLAIVLALMLVEA